MRPYSFRSFVACTKASGTSSFPLRKILLVLPVSGSVSVTMRSKSKRQRCTLVAFCAFFVGFDFLKQLEQK